MSKTTTHDLDAKIKAALRAADATADTLYDTRIALTGANAAIDVLRPFLDAYAEQGRKLEAAEIEAGKWAETARVNAKSFNEEVRKTIDQAATIAALKAEVANLKAFVTDYTHQAEASGGWKGDDDLFNRAIALTTQGEGS